MEKLNKNELLACNGGNIITAITGIFFSFINVVKKFKVAFGGRR